VSIVTLGLNHRTAPVEVREQVAFTEDAQADALHRLVHDYGLGEAAIVATCNRSEFYVAAECDCVEVVKRFLTESRGMTPEQLESCFYALSDEDAAGHLFKVACGIDSLVVGESQILSQVRGALEQAQHGGSAGVLINELFQRALHAGKRARSETDIGRGRLSISTAAVELAGQIFDDLSSCSALLVGAGEMGELTAQYLLDACVRELLVTNRTAGRAVELARRVGGQAIPFEHLPEQLGRVDIVISTTAAPGFVITAEMLAQTMRQRRGRPLFLIDIAVPRDIAPEVRDFDNVFLFDIDDLEQVVAANRAERESEILKVQALVDEELQSFVHWLNGLQAGPLIRQLRAQADRLRAAELARWSGKLDGLSAEQRQLVESVLRGYANKLLHAPLVQVREFANAPDGHARLEAVRRLFGLAATDEPSQEVER
jgi:glutamyl-tRNA reductase